MSKHIELSQRVKAGLSSKLAERLANNKLFPKPSSLSSSAKMRVELLNLSRESDLARWQVLHNDGERYRIITEKESHQKGEYFVRIIYCELGDDLPIVKTQQELREE